MYLFVVHAMQRTKTKASFWQLMDFINTKLLVELYRMKLLHLLQHVRFIFAIILNLSSSKPVHWSPNPLLSRGRIFYGSGGSYDMFVGRDATRALALMSLDPQDLTANTDDSTVNLSLMFFRIGSLSFKGNTPKSVFLEANRSCRRRL
ncbi:hypothetical protein SOVF_090150 [Spinacia oleracea]|nr:hypothetical protein SOVF_090150 [Spinacia oleracea]